MRRFFMRSLVLALLASIVGCASTNKPATDYSAFRQHHPTSIVVLPPLNNTVDLRATYSSLSSVTAPLAESGYYVFPVALVDQTFKENGLTTPGDMHQVSPAKLHEIFGADAALYITITRYGANSALLGGDVVVSAQAVLIDTRTSTKLWEGSASASNAEGKQQQQGGVLGLLIQGIANQIANSVGDPAVPIARLTNQRLLNASSGGLLYGPRSPRYVASQP
jgi:hypothetical protein